MDVYHMTKTLHRSSYPATNLTPPSNSTNGKVIAVTRGAGGISCAIAQAVCELGVCIIMVLARRQDLLEQSVAMLRSKYNRHLDIQC